MKSGAVLYLTPRADVKEKERGKTRGGGPLSGSLGFSTTEKKFGEKKKGSLLLSRHVFWRTGGRKKKEKRQRKLFDFLFSVMARRG